jgi:hypothetical protein
MRSGKLAAVVVLVLISYRYTNAESITVLLTRAQGGDADAQFELGKELFKGKQAAPDSRAGFRWICESAWQGNSDAQERYAENLAGFNGVLHAWGFNQSGKLDVWDRCRDCVKPLHKHLVESYDWLRIVSLHGKQNKVLEKQLKRELSLDEIQYAERAAGDWKPVIVRPWRANPACGVWNSPLPAAQSGINQSGAPVEVAASAAMQRIRNTRYTPMPAPICSHGSSGSTLTLENRTKFLIDFYAVGETSRTIEVAPSSSRVIDLSPGDYQIAAEIPSSSATPFFGERTFSAGTQCKLAFSMPEGGSAK